MDGGFTTDALAHDRLIAWRLAGQRPYWTPGSAYGYHTFVIGALIGEVVHRATGRFCIPSLTTVSPDKEQIGDLAVAFLLGRIDGTRTGPSERVEVPCRLIIRESTIETSQPPQTID